MGSALRVHANLIASLGALRDIAGYGALACHFLHVESEVTSRLAWLLRELANARLVATTSASCSTSAAPAAP